LCMPLDAVRWRLQAIMKPENSGSQYVPGRTKETTVQETRETTSSARGNGGPDVYDISKSYGARHDLRLAWQGS
jgi:hypothetical protein